MEVTLEQLMSGKSTLIKGNEYFSTEAYVTPFLERMSKFTDKFIYQAKLPDQISVSNIGDLREEDTVWNRVWVQALLPSDLAIENHTEVIGMVYGLDTRKPIFKIYKGVLNNACLNLSVFNPSFLSVQEIEPRKAVNYSPIGRIMDMTNDVVATLNRMKETEVPYDEQLINENLGMWIRNTMSKSFSNELSGKVKIAASTAVDAYKLLYEKKDSPYYVKPGEVTDLFNVYNSFTELITNDGTKEDRYKDVLNKFEKTLLVKDIMGL